MGVKSLNSYLLDNCSKNAIKKVPLSTLKGKKIAVDTSIYIYKFMSENQLLEKIYLLIVTLQHYEIEPIFVFDGKAPEEKKELLEQRRTEKLEATQKYNELMKQLDDKNHYKNDDTEKKMKLLRRKMVSINDGLLKSVRELMDAYGVTCLVSTGEADALCAHLMNKNIVWGCMSDDMDMFLYGEGKNVILRGISLINHTVYMYDQSNILFELDMEQNEFTKIAVLSGTDYNIHFDLRMDGSMELYKKYKMDKTKDMTMDYYEWLQKNNMICEEEYNIMKRACNIFRINDSDMYDKFEKCINTIKKKRGGVNMEKVRTIMEQEGFIFVV